MSIPAVASRQEWPAARTQLLAREKELTRQQDALNAARRRLPMTRIAKDARGTEPAVGAYPLLDLTALGRQEDWEQPAGRPGMTRHADPSFS